MGALKGRLGALEGAGYAVCCSASGTINNLLNNNIFDNFNSF